MSRRQQTGTGRGGGEGVLLNYVFPNKLDDERLKKCFEEPCGACLFELKDSETKHSAVKARRDEKIGLLDSCSHTFHFKCINMWLQRDSSCPQCKARVDHAASYSFDGSRVSWRAVEEVLQNFEESSDEDEEEEDDEEEEEEGDEEMGVSELMELYFPEDVREGGATAGKGKGDKQKKASKRENENMEEDQIETSRSRSGRGTRGGRGASSSSASRGGGRPRASPSSRSTSAGSSSSSSSSSAASSLRSSSSAGGRRRRTGAGEEGVEDASASSSATSSAAAATAAAGRRRGLTEAEREKRAEERSKRQEEKLEAEEARARAVVERFRQERRRERAKRKREEAEARGEGEEGGKRKVDAETLKNRIERSIERMPFSFAVARPVENLSEEGGTGFGGGLIFNNGPTGVAGQGGGPSKRPVVVPVTALRRVTMPSSAFALSNSSVRAEGSRGGSSSSAAAASSSSSSSSSAAAAASVVRPSAPAVPRSFGFGGFNLAPKYSEDFIVDAKKCSSGPSDSDKKKEKKKDEQEKIEVTGDGEGEEEEIEFEDD